MIRKEAKHIDVSDIPELLRIAEEVHETGESRILKRDNEELAVVGPTKPVGRRRVASGVLTKDDPLSKLVGSLTSEEPTDASKKHEYLAQTHPSG